MDITQIIDRQQLPQDSKTETLYTQFKRLLDELRKKPLTDGIVSLINAQVNELNASPATGNEFRKLLKAKQTKIIGLVEKTMKIVPKNHYRNLWMVIGMSAFGLPIGVAFGLIAKNLGLLAIGLPI